MRNTKKIYISLIWIAICLVSLFSFSYSWIRKDWSPTLTQQTVRVQTGGSLVIKITAEDDAAYNQISINDIIGLPTSFRLKQVSNATGKSEDFFNIDYSEGKYNSKIKHLTKGSGESYSDLGKANGYIETEFILHGVSITETFGQYIYLSPDSFVSCETSENAANNVDNEQKENLISALRMSITIKGTTTEGAQDNDSTFCIKFKEDDETPLMAIKLGYTEDGIFHPSHNQDYFKIDNGEYVVNNRHLESVETRFKPLSYYTNAVTENNEGVKSLDTSRTLFRMASSEKRRIVVRIWLEGEDPGCNESISDLTFNLNLSFSGFSDKSSEQNGE